MIFKSSTVALVVSTLLAVNANANDLEVANQQLSVGNATLSTIDQKSDQKSSFETLKESSGVYLIRLSEKNALDAAYATMGNDRSQIITRIDKQQNKVLASLRQLDDSVILTRKARLTENALYVQMSHSTVEQLKNNTDVLSVELLNEEPSYTSADEFSKFPFLEIKDPGDSVTVAIVGNGIDYTHKALGGEGTAEAYDKAWANKSNAWNGFPTDTVIGGLDFSAFGESQWHEIDYNPIEDVSDINVESGAVPSGTAVAAQVLAQAPDAKILFYKSWDWDSRSFYPVLDVIVDPNQDGDFSDRPDVIVLNSWGNGAFYVEDDTNGSGSTREINLVRRLSAAGSLVVVGAGQTYFDSYFNLAWRAAAPEALTVGSVSINEESIVLSDFTPAGPTRGTQQLKPEVVAPAENIVAPIAGSGDGEGDFIAHSTYAAAYVAGTVAKILAEYPQLSPVEAKALVTNTAIADGIEGTTSYNAEYDATTTKVAEVPFIGTGLVNGDVAVTASAFVWETASYQPGLAFGFVEASSSAAVSRDVTIKNFTDEVQTYSLSTVTNGDKVNNAAVSFIHPETINVPANRSVVFNVTMTVDASKLTEQSILSTDDYTIANFTKENVNGYIVFDNADESSAQLKMPWQVFPKNAEKLVKSEHSEGWGIPYEAQYWVDKVRAAMTDAITQTVKITNASVQPKTIYTVPVMRSIEAISASKKGGQGQFLKNIGASIVNEPMCTSGSKLTVALQMFDKFDLPMAEHFDKAGHLITYFTIYDADYVDSKNNDPVVIDQDEYKTDDDILAYIEVLMDNDGKLQTTYVNFDEVYEWWNPRKRFKNSSLATDGAPGDDTVVSNICLDELLHGDVQSADSWDNDLGWQFATDRDAQADIGDTMIRYNPVVMGRAFAEIIDHTGEIGYPQYTWDPCSNEGTDPMFGGPKPEDYCLEEANTFVAYNTALAKLSDEEEAELTWSNKVTLMPEETALFSVSVVDQCDTQRIRTSTWTAHKDCPPSVMVFELGSDNTSFTNSNYGHDLGVKQGQAFSVYENAQNGTEVGTLTRHAEAFFTLDEHAKSIYLVNSLPGTPFQVDTDGVITVANSAALDYEETKSLTLKVQADYVNRDTQVVDVVIKINNRNDVAPEVIDEIATISAKVGEPLTASISNAFTDAEGDGITFSSNNLPTGLALSKSGVITGTLQTAGNFQANVVASDGANTVSANLDFAVTPATQATTPEATPDVDNSTSRGGGTGVLFMLFAALAFFNRQARK